MSQEHLAHLIHAQTAAIADLERRISAYAATRRVLRVLALEELTVGQAISILVETAERTDDPASTTLYQETIAALRQMQAGEP